MYLKLIYGLENFLEKIFKNLERCFNFCVVSVLYQNATDDVLTTPNFKLKILKLDSKKKLKII